MIRPISGQYWTTLAILTLAAGSAAAAEDEQDSRHLEMEVVEVVERAAPAPVSKDDYFSGLAAKVNADLVEDLRANLTASALTSYQMLAAELALNNGTRVVANDSDSTDSPATEDTRSSGT